MPSKLSQASSPREEHHEDDDPLLSASAFDMEHQPMSAAPSKAARSLQQEAWRCADGLVCLERSARAAAGLGITFLRINQSVSYMSLILKHVKTEHGLCLRTNSSLLSWTPFPLEERCWFERWSCSPSWSRVNQTEWFVGFSEGDGSFIISKDRLFFRHVL